MITPGSRLIGRKYDFFLKLAYEELNLLGLWRKGAKYRTRFDDEAMKINSIIEIPKLGSLILKHDIDAEIKGLKDFPPDEIPPSEIIFWSFRIMVGIGMAMIALGLWSLLLRWKNKFYSVQHLAPGGGS